MLFEIVWFILSFQFFFFLYISSPISAIHQSPSIFTVRTLFLRRVNREITIPGTWQSRSLCQSASHFFWRGVTPSFFSFSSHFWEISEWNKQRKHAVKCSEHRSPLNSKDIISALISRNRVTRNFPPYLLYYLCFEVVRDVVEGIRHIPFGYFQGKPYTLCFTWKL